MIDIARHQVGAADVDLLLAAVVEVVNAAVFQKTPHDADHFDVIADPRHAGPQTADAAHQQLDLARPPAMPDTAARIISGIHQRVHLENQMALAPGLAVLDLALDHGLQSLPQVHRRHQQLCNRPWTSSRSDS